ncbi:hypothetical protein CI109_101719 [Kwoniella shandongensis]|uniref:Uncharacterized protein n=1 Tax=Kwoniella shandongensis TaxID=1734106 RepID=A0A5M6C5D3_9TREE|nr:uncharacterized protein CI109_001158 [Kwoniella shandongensis]KAA5530357.1 hypothetical protein CI109_001158 [Kwoniella shandongensis]
MNGQDSNYPNSPYDSQHWWEGPPRANDGQDLTERFGGLSIDESDQSYCNPAPSSGGSTGIPEEFRSVRESLAKAKEARLKAEGMTGKGTAAAEARDMDTHQSLPLDVYRETFKSALGVAMAVAKATATAITPPMALALALALPTTLPMAIGKVLAPILKVRVPMPTRDSTQLRERHGTTVGIRTRLTKMKRRKGECRVRWD